MYYCPSKLEWQETFRNSCKGVFIILSFFDQSIIALIRNLKVFKTSLLTSLRQKLWTNKHYFCAVIELLRPNFLSNPKIILKNGLAVFKTKVFILLYYKRTKPFHKNSTPKCLKKIKL